MYHVGDLDDIEDGAARRVVVGSTSIALVRIGDRVSAIGDTCTHGNVSLSEGEVDVEHREIECWKHGSVFSLDTGVPQCLPATEPTPVYRATVLDGHVMVEL